MHIFKKITLKISICIFLSTSFVFAQKAVFKFEDFPVTLNGIPKKIAFSGGLNASQFGLLDLNNDSIHDLVVFDKISGTINTFLKNDTSGFNSAPQYISALPPIVDWLIIADYNNDSKPDIFTGSSEISGNIKVYKNISINDNLQFELVKNKLEHKRFTGELLSIVNDFYNYPSIMDVDGDGDLDIFTYQQFGYGGIEFYENLSADSNYIEAFHFIKYSACWGKFQISSNCDNLVLLNKSCRGFGGYYDNLRTMHGGSSIRLQDFNDDDKIDILLGDVTCGNIFVLTNGGNNLNASITGQYKLESTKGVIDSLNFPLISNFDINNDNVRDFVFSTNNADNASDLLDLSKSNALFLNTGTNNAPILSFTGKHFLQDDMIDLGENAYPAFYDYDGDGDQDLFVSSKGMLKDGIFRSSLYLYQNIGTDSVPSFDLSDNDFMNLAKENFTYLKPVFFDLNSDGKTDLLFTAKGISFTNAYVIYNTNGTNIFFSDENRILSTINFSGDANFNQLQANDQLLTYKLQGQIQLLLIREEGGIEWYSNISFSGQNTSTTFIKKEVMGFVNNYYETGLLTSAIGKFNGDTLDDFAYINRKGYLSIIYNFDLNSNTHLSDSLLITFSGKSLSTQFGRNNYITKVDINKDTKDDICVGTGNGGLYFIKNYSYKPILSNIPISDTASTNFSEFDKFKNGFLFYPNPASDMLTILSKNEGNVNIYTIDNILVHSTTIRTGYSQFIVNNLKSGIYVIEFESGDKKLYNKLFKK